MTRFARAKGSKASNERREEDPTPWHVMRQQLAEQLLNKSQSDNASSLQGIKKEVLNQNIKPTEEVWSDFSEAKFGIDQKSIKSNKQKTVGKKEIVFSQERKQNSNSAVQPLKDTNKTCKETLTNKETSKISEAKYNTGCIGQKSVKNDVVNYSETKRKKGTVCSFKNNLGFIVENKKSLPVSQNLKSDETYKSGTTVKINTFTEETTDELKNKVTMDELPQNVKIKKENNVNKKKRKNTNKEEPPLKIKIKKEINKKILSKSLADEKGACLKSTSCSTVFSNNALKKSKNNFLELSETNQTLMLNDAKKNADKGYSEKFSWNRYNTVQTIFANGRKIRIVKYEAFWVKENDAAKLKQLKKMLKGQNIPNDKIKAIMQLERRKAEKALAREKTNVCYHCRTFGHKLSECPDIKDTEMPNSGMCYKCGSLEHSHFECKVTNNQGFRYAVCFVCKEQGHIARQCPLNPQGQYPKGGCCHLCGETTHLRKDCPKAVEEKPSSSFVLEKIKSDHLEDLTGIDTTNKKTVCSTKNKVVKF